MEQKGYQRIELIPLLALIRDHNGDSTVYVYDGNGNLVSKTDADGYVTRYSYTALDLVKKINYNGAKEVSYQYNKVGELVQMDDWTDTNTFELDLLGRLQKMTDHKGNTVSYAYDAVGNQTGITYPDGSKFCGMEVLLRAELPFPDYQNGRRYLEQPYPYSKCSTWKLECRIGIYSFMWK